MFTTIHDPLLISLPFLVVDVSSMFLFVQIRVVVPTPMGQNLLAIYKYHMTLISLCNHKLKVEPCVFSTFKSNSRKTTGIPPRIAFTPLKTAFLLKL